MTYWRKRAAAAVTALLLAGELCAQGAPTIRNVEIRHKGMGKSDSEFVVAHTRVRAGQELHSQAVSQDVRLLLGTGQFSNVDAEVEEAEGGVTLVYTVQTKLRLAEDPTIHGVKEFRESKVLKWLGLYEGELVDDQVVGVAVRKVLKEYRDESYADATCTWSFEPTDPELGLVRLKIVFKEGSVGYIGNIQIQGNDSISTGDLRKALKRPSPFNPFRWVRRKRYDGHELADIEANVRRQYMSRGFLDVQVAVSVIETPDKAADIADIRVVEGVQYFVDNITLEGITLFPEAELRRMVALRSGQVASSALIDATASRLQSYYGDRGYLHAGTRPLLTPDPEQGTVDIAFVIKEGELVRIRNIVIRGNTRTRDKVIRRELLVYPGEVYNQTRVRRSESRINNLGFFETARAIPQETGDPDERDLIFDVAEKRTGQFMLGAGFSSVDKLIGFVELSQGNFDLLGWPNFTGGGQKLRMRAQFGSRRKDYELSLTEPWFMDRRLSLGFDIYRRDRDYSDYEVERTGASISLGKALPGANRINLRYNIEESIISDVTDTNTYFELDSYDFDTDTGTPYLFESEQDRIKSELRVTLVHDSRNNPFIPTRGSKLSLFYSVAGGPMGFDTDIYDVGLKTTSYLPLWFGHVINLRTRFEFVEPFGDTDVVPLSDRLFLGGGRTLRGFSYRDVGPKVIRPIEGVVANPSDPTSGYYDRSYGGQSLFMANLEYTIPIVQGIRFGIFYDTGNVWSDAYDLYFNDLASSYGMGIRLDMPGFPIRIDRAWAIDKDDDFTNEDNWVIWIGYDY
jgi:outer membrane protein insertion porin family